MMASVCYSSQRHPVSAQASSHQTRKAAQSFESAVPNFSSHLYWDILIQNHSPFCPEIGSAEFFQPPLLGFHAVPQ
jgi:hypothetical protein